jgi:hypothetical protein
MRNGFLLIAMQLEPSHYIVGNVKPNTITIRLRRPKAEIEAKAKPNVEVWINNLIDQALGPIEVDWNEHFDRKSKTRRFRYRASEMRRNEP